MRERFSPRRKERRCLLVLSALAFGSCTFQSFVVIDNDYQSQLVTYRAFWQAVSLQTPIPPGSSSEPQETVPASANTAYVLLAPGWNPRSAEPPTSFMVMQSRNGFGVHLNDTLHIPVDDATFIGNCQAGSFLTQAEADFITQGVFASTFTGLSYNAEACATAGP